GHPDGLALGRGGGGRHAARSASRAPFGRCVARARLRLLSTTLRRLTRYIGRGAIALLVIAFVVLAGFRGWALLREVEAPDTAVGGGAKWVALAAGRSIHYREWGSGDGPALLLIHGTSAWSETWRDVAVPLGDAGYRVLAPDMPPFGYSHRPADGDY